MTSREVFIGVLIELDKTSSPQAHLADFIYYYDLASLEVTDEVYKEFEVTQKSLDLFKSLKQFLMVPNSTKGTVDPGNGSTILLSGGEFPNSVKFNLPSNYRHLTNVIVNYEAVAKNNLCKTVGSIFPYGAKKMDSDEYASIISDPFQKPSTREPKWSIIGNTLYVFTGSDPAYQISSIQMDYLKLPQRIELTYQQAFQDEEDNSQILEFDDIMVKKIKARVIQKFMERAKDNRLSSHLQLNQMQVHPDISSPAKNLI